VDSSNTVIVSVMVEEKGKQTANEKEGRKPWTLREFGGKTLWDWMGLLIVPVVLSLITVVFAWQQDIRQDQIEKKRAKAERELAKERAQDEALQAYLDQMSNLLLERNLRESAKDSEVSSLARARTLTVLSRLDSARKERLLQFLYEAGLLHKENPVVDLNGGDLSGIDLRNNNISGSGTFLIDVSGLQPYGGKVESSKAANLSGAILSDANLEGALLFNTDLSDAHLSDAELSKAGLSSADLSNADLSDADLSNAGLRAANLNWAKLGGANLNNADLSGANLRYADLRNADLSDAKGITNEELEQQAALSPVGDSLKGATMPNGQKYEDWLKSKGSGKD
jgi:uncharacterized protein YjbI with pentapeptide repeats